ncbi:TPA: signal peptidase I [Streptococcus suis]|nr:signal peptidase I [Streptococcus suis]
MKKLSFAGFLAEWGLFTLFIVGFILSRLYIWSPVTVDGHSMDPTLLDQEHLIMVRTTSIQRFDVVVASETDTNGKEKLIVKRVIGMPGDTIRYENDVLYINGQEVDEPYLDQYLAAYSQDKLQSVYSYNANFQALALESTAFTMDANKYASFTIQVPENQYFLLGDDRLVSQDSRHVGTFSADQIEGEIKLRIWPFNRIGTVQ